ncbi:YncE family protein [Nocardia coubleae]|uniref:YncE family protein n=1 Tax=Nocardia coubleae TaxID=356147 RepID=A0A846W604_9NOCA|nr:YncE family protein [Nocardia coubleae]NKX88702.1 YncE family protein [Nocardia coubleae]
MAHYADSTDQQTVSVIDTRTRDVAARIPVGKVYPHGPQSIAVDPVTHLVYLVCGNSAGQVVVISPDTDTVTTTIDFEGDPFAVVVDPDRSTLYVANRLSRTVTAIDTITRTVRATIAVDGYPTGLAVDPNTHHLWVVNEGNVSVIDPTTYTVSTNFAVGKDPVHIAIDHPTHTAYVTHFNGHSVSLFDTASRTPAGSVSLGDRVTGYAAVIDPAEHTVYLTGMAHSTVSMIDTRTRTLTAARLSGITPSTEYGSSTWGAAVDPATHHLYVTNEDIGRIEIIAHR